MLKPAIFLRYRITLVLRNLQFCAAMATGVAAHLLLVRVKGVYK